MVHRCLNGRAPQYLADDCVPLSRQRQLRSAERNLLRVPRHRLRAYGRRAFAIASPHTPQPERHRSYFQALAKTVRTTKMKLKQN